jgi:hypothetical protein
MILFQRSLVPLSRQWKSVFFFHPEDGILFSTEEGGNWFL